MRNLLSIRTLAFVASFMLLSFYAQAQQPKLQYYRPWDKDGINTFEPSKSMDQPAYEGLKVRIGGSFTQTYQSLSASNNADYVKVSNTNNTNKNLLYGVAMTNSTLVNARPFVEDSLNVSLNGFNLAMANLNFDFQIEDGIRVCLENYMSARHHNEFWVKGGYIQIDKLPMFNSPEWFTKYMRVKIGHFQPNFGDQQFRRGDGGNAIFNPFAENFLMDAFTTEIGGEVYVFPVDGLMLMGGMSSGLINGNVENYPDKPVGSNLEPTQRNPSIFVKAAYDKQISSDLRVRLSGSLYNNSSIQRNTLYAGDRTGSQYFSIMDPIVQASGTPTDKTAVFTSGRINPNITNRVTAFVINPFVKFKGLEFFGAYETVKGGNYSEADDRSFTQIAVEGLYRFLPNEQAYIGGRYVTVTGRLAGFAEDINVNRLAVAAGWFPTRNLLLKGEYVIQKYEDFPSTDYRHEGEFSGFVIQAVIGF